MSGQTAEAASATGAAPHPLRSDIVELARLAGPVVAGRVGMMAMGLTDAIVVGRYSAAQLGYHALAWAVTTCRPSGSRNTLATTSPPAASAIAAGWVV